MIKVIYKHSVIMLISSGLLACAGPVSDTDEGNSSRLDCIYQSSIRGYTVLDEANLIVEGSGRRSYHVGLQRRAYGLKSSWSIAFSSPTNRICARFSELIYEGNFEKESIRISSIRELTAEDEEDLLIQYGKKEPEIKQTPAPAEVPGAEVEELDPAAND
jgi:hypothetical protein